MPITYKVVEYRPLLMQYAISYVSGDEFIPFNEWLIKQGYKFKVMDKVFDDFEEMWAYCEMLTMQLCENITFEIVKKEILCNE